MCIRFKELSVTGSEHLPKETRWTKRTLQSVFCRLERPSQCAGQYKQHQWWEIVGNTRPDSSLRYRRYINHLLTYLLTVDNVFKILWPKYMLYFLHFNNKIQLEMWANAQRDGRPAVYRWRPLFNAAKFGWRPLLECRAVMLPSRETRWNYLGCPKLTKWSQPLVGRSSPYCEDMWRRQFFPTVDTCLSCEDIARQSCAMVRRWRFFGSFLRPVFAASRVQHISDMYSKFALRPHHV